MARAKRKPVKQDKYSSLKPKIHPLTIAGIIGFFVVVLGLILVLQPNEQTRFYNAYMGVAVEARTAGLSEKNPFSQVTYNGGLFDKGLKDILEDEELVIVYIGTPTCSVCVSHVGAFQAYFESREVNLLTDSIYYINSQADQTSVIKLQELFPESVTNVTPQLIAFKNGEVIETFEVLSSTTVSEMNLSVRNFYNAVKTHFA